MYSLSGTKISDEYALLSISDVHLLHPKTPTRHIANNFVKYVLNESTLRGVKLFVIAGDFYDREGVFHDDDVQTTIELVANIIKVCAMFDIVLRVLKGTPWHDRDQSINFITIAKVLGLPVDVKYIETIEIETIESLGISVLYVPDEVNYDTAVTLKQVRALMESRGFEQVDYAVMHGLFDFQVPEVISPHIKHDTQAYLKMVSKNIVIGHDHHMQTNGRIGINGSFDRLAHNEEHPKGFLKIHVRPYGNEWEFVENKGALPYVTYKVYTDDLEVSLEKLFKKVEKLPAGSHVRVLTTRANPMFNALTSLKVNYPLLHWKIESKEKKVTQITQTSLPKQKHKPIAITKETLPALIKENLLIDRSGESGFTMDDVLSRLTELSR
mgnify:CR=1 FL=1